MKANSGNFKLRSPAFPFLIAMLLTACASSTPSSPSPEPTARPAIEPQAGSHPPVILQVVDRDEYVNGFQYIYSDIFFTDPDGDAVAITYREVSSSLSYPFPLSDDPIQASVEEQQERALFTFGGRCPNRMALALELRIRDQTGNLSEPVLAQFSCTTPPVVDVGSILVSGLGIAASIALLLALAFWLVFRKHPEQKRPALRSMLLLSCLILPVNFIGSILHEGGHALYVALRGIPIVLYVHPFAFPGYARPFIDNSTLFNVAGSLTVLPVSLLISLAFWKRRSTGLLPLLLLFPGCAIYNGLNVLGVGGADFRNPVQFNGLPSIPFQILGALIVVAGILLLFTIFPLFGLHPGDKTALFVLPAGMFLAGFLSFLVAITLVPGSAIDRQYFLGQEIVSAARLLLLIHPALWALLAVLYVTLYPRAHPRLPTWLRTEAVQLSWKDLRLPAFLAVLSVVLGLIIIT